MDKKIEIKTIRSLLNQQKVAVQHKDIAGAIRNYDESIHLFDVVGPLQQKGLNSLKKRLEEWFSSFEAEAEVAFEIVDLTVIVGEDQAMSYGFNHVQTLVKTGV